jgi:methylated-DNA-[protein]-cysteine S-methyltransferase
MRQRGRKFNRKSRSVLRRYPNYSGDTASLEFSPNGIGRKNAKRRFNEQGKPIMQLFLSRLGSPLGDMMLVTDEEQSIRALEFADHKARLRRHVSEHYGAVEWIDGSAPQDIAQAIAEYFAGDLESIGRLRTAAAGSELQHKVWAALRRIPAGATTSYGKLAKALGFDDPRAAIDIGAANGANPIAIVVPCHRVIASNGDLKGYAWGLPRKRWLLEHEKAITPSPVSSSNGTLPGF